ncbi:hypothetical protein BDV33DRAFT_185800 [Aspergillus novoparasiticus]|uniref:VWFA domain-containing protein n=1 Tax=Aspergillus novoparasiticus TaxID=986946 RepID=A0A5N6E5V8_9EURO|nr:hypothetical protein BDV33DRAFT_185800 [Aspergillus novoparasiticus]
MFTTCESALFSFTRQKMPLELLDRLNLKISSRTMYSKKHGQTLDTKDSLTFPSLRVLSDLLRAILEQLRPCDRLSIVNLQRDGKQATMTRLTSKTWSGWERVLKLNSAQSNYAAPSLFEGIQAAICCLVAEQSAQRASKLLLVSDIVDHVYLSQSNVDNITSGAIANGVSIYSLGVGLHYNADLLSSLSRRTSSLYVYVKHCSQLRECMAAIFYSFQTIQLARVRLLLRSPASSFQIVSSHCSYLIPTPDDKEGMDIDIGDLMSGEVKDILVNIEILPSSKASAVSKRYKVQQIDVYQFPLLQFWLSSSESRRSSIISVPFDCFSDLPASTLSIIQLPIVRRQVEIRISHLLEQALSWARKGQQKNAEELLKDIQELVNNTKIGLRSAYCKRVPVSMHDIEGSSSRLLVALCYDLNNFAEWIKYPEVFAQHWRKSVLQAIDAVSLQRSFTTDTWVEAYLLGLRRKAKGHRES